MTKHGRLLRPEKKTTERKIEHRATKLRRPPSSGIIDAFP